MTIAEMQQIIINAGQFRERIYNDDLAESRDCYLELSKHRSPHVFDIRCNDPEVELARKDNVGWGRRQTCWEYAHTYVMHQSAKGAGHAPA